jgi:MotA/TolQ/ExbB proton channel family
LGPSDGYQSTVEIIWRASDLVECAIFLGLALMLACTVFVTVRFFRRYTLARGESCAPLVDSASASEQGKKNLAADLSRGVEALQSIAFAAPFLGLAGTCYGILCLFVRISNGKLFSTSAISFELSTALVATAAGIIVAVPAAISYNILRMCLEKFESSRSSRPLEATPRTYGFAQTLLLRRRFSRMPAFALIGVPVLAILSFFAFFQRFVPLGLPVRIMEIGVSDRDSEPIIISVVDRSASIPALYVNSKEIPWSELGNTLRRQLKARPHWTVYVEGGSDVPWHLIAYPIDVARGLHAEVVLLTARPKIDSVHPAHKAKNKKEERVR